MGEHIEKVFVAHASCWIASTFFFTPQNSEIIVYSCYTAVLLGSEIVIVNINTHTVEVLDRGTENFEEFHRFITNDLPTGASFSMKVLDVQT